MANTNGNEFINYILEHPDKPWNYGCLSGNPNITWEHVEANPDKHWSYKSLSKNPNITWEHMEANPDKPWSYLEMSNNKLTKHPFFQIRQLSYVLK
jgi:hypothetical protein